MGTVIDLTSPIGIIIILISRNNGKDAVCYTHEIIR
jgi:hypothetical protein